MIEYKTVVSSPAFDSYRSARVRSLFNVSEVTGATHEVKVSLPIDEKEWQIGAVIGPSGTGKTTLGRLLFEGGRLHQGFEWSRERPIIDEIGSDKNFDAVTGALSSVGLGSVPSWLRPFHVLSQGEQFRADLARLIIEEPAEVVVDEFTSVVDRKIAKIGAGAFAKAWRRTPGRVVILSCHYDIIEWLCPDWVLDTQYWDFTWGHLRRRPEIPLDIYAANSARAWRIFEPHHYLKLPLPIAATYYIGEVGGEPVAHLAASPRPGLKQCRFTRLVVMPEWQGAGVGMRFLEYVAELWRKGNNRYGKPMLGVIHTSHPGLIAALNRSPKWVLVSQQMGGSDRKRYIESIQRSIEKGCFKRNTSSASSGYGGHLRAVAGFKYIGENKGEKTA
jgi:ABC-type ATPase involved in cell division/GNAT superfamily N-acetyltransferase